MTVSIPGINLSILRQQTSVQAGLPLLISGRFTAFGLGVPAFIRVFLEGPSYDPQLRSFDTFASPFSGDYTVNVLAEKDGQYTVFAQAFPPPLLPSGPLTPDATLLLPAFAESTRPPLVVGLPFDGGVEITMPDGSTQKVETPPMQPIEFSPIISVGAPSVVVSGLGGEGPTVAGFPYLQELPSALPPVPGTAAISKAYVDSIALSPNVINPGMEATGVMSWRNTGESPERFDIVLYLLSTQGVRYGPLQVKPSVSATPQVPSTLTVRLGTAGLISGTYSVVAEVYSSASGMLATSRTLPNVLEIRTIAAPTVPVPPAPTVPERPTTDVLGLPVLNLSRQINVGDTWSGTVNLPTLGAVQYFIEGHVLLVDSSGREFTVGQGSRTLYPGETLQVPVNYNTAGFTAGNYSILLRVFDQLGGRVTTFSLGNLSMIEAALAALPAPPSPLIPEVPEAPATPTSGMFGTASVNLPSQVEIGKIWSGYVSLPTRLPSELAALPSLPSYPADIGLQLQNPQGQRYSVGTFKPTFSPGQTINLPVDFNTGVLPAEGPHSLLLNISDITGKPVISSVIGSLMAMLPAALPELPELPELPTPVVPAPPAAPPRADLANYNFVLLSSGPFDPGDTVRWQASGVYKGIVQPGSMQISLGIGVVPAFLARFTLPSISENFAASLDWAPFNFSGSFTIPPGVTRGQTYSVQSKLSTLIDPTQEIDTDYGIITIKEAPSPSPAPAPLPSADIANFNFMITSSGPFDPGNRVSWQAVGVYKGRAQRGTIDVALGTGVAPTFFQKFIMGTTSVNFAESKDWAPFNFSGSFLIPSNAETGRTYNSRATIAGTTEATQEIDTDYSALTIKAAAAAPTKKGFAISLMSGNYPTAKIWFANFNERYYGNNLPVTTLWQISNDLGASGERGTLTVKLYDANFKRVKQSAVTATLQNGHAYEFYPDTNRFVDAGIF